ncbi:hypothetical protein WICPIJ_002985 [Wickerhamomyces pijperi]|uniref:Vacuolar protein sorting-associated protein 45 n=1 Tax=Wickerhamomyces pijperi TaxID=599730 RepID=A0A9P8TPL5_WICPI|nr:hypothetical protein WICPIJ_002985 [Wickerhamomyces pijperi]
MDLYKVSDFYLNLLVDGEDPARRQHNSNSNKQSSFISAPSSAIPGSKIKVLLLDQHTTSIISLNSTQSELLRHDIYLITRIDNATRDKMKHLKAIVYIKPTDESINYLLEELGNPKYDTYEIFFTNMVSKSQLEKLAEADDSEVVVKVQEVFQDYLTINKDLFHFDMKIPKNRIYGDNLGSWSGFALNRTVEGLTSLLLSLKAKPVIRYEYNSPMGSKLAQEMLNAIEKPQNSSLFDFKLADTPPVLLILDRKNDPITPLLLPWTFQSMVHELIGIDNNTVDLSHTPGISKELEKIVLSSKQDQFFAESMYLNFGDLSDKIKSYVTDYKSKTNSNKKIESIEDMKQFIEEFPEFKKLSGNVSKHMTLASEINRQLNQQRLWEVSEIEQNLSSNDQHNQDLKEIENILNNVSTDPQAQAQPPISMNLKLRLVILYALRYETNSNNQIQRLKSILNNQGIPQQDLLLIDYFLQYSGVRKRLNDEDNIFDKATSNLLISGFKTNHKSDNIFMQHIPRLENIISKITRGKLTEKNYPLLSPYAEHEYSNINVGSNNNQQSGKLSLEKPQDIIIFFVGGVTYEEARIVDNLTKQNPSLRIILGGSCIHNTRSFMDEIRDAGERWPRSTR